MDLSEEFRKFLELDLVDIDSVMRDYFGKYWNDFGKWWLKKTTEKVDWVTFALAPHNSEYFTQWVFSKHPDVAKKVKMDLEAFKDKY